ncbi:hypothetical protein GE253_06945 [Niveispirillum sp. SYP-B3756]|uniref:TldD/PmbA family protein n=1 Tax=Niveispirillum sp. SYP-B3756 TaxID=2662178 RepID=UPI00129262DC|nr:metallopeptidase TldD-related protein [Niveispirillum sp. SYP-B3756]MQP65082.1 hypothetical protein [Niveispirillum sp. SYP-B3756]
MSELLTRSEGELRVAAARAVELAVQRGAAARATASNHGFARIVIRDGVVETAERSGGQSLSVTVFREGRRGSASTESLDRAAIERVVEEAMLIAGHVQPDPDAALPPADWLAITGPAPELYAEGPRGTDTLMAAAGAIDRAAVAVADAVQGRLRVSESVALASENIWALATSDGFCRSARSSQDGRWCAMLAQDGGGSTSDYCQSQGRRADALLPAQAIAERAAERALSALGARTVKSGRYPVLFDARTAHSLVGELAGALTGMAQHRKMSFLANPLGRAVAAPHLDLIEDPFEPLGMASGGFDSEGIAGSTRAILRKGVAEGLFLSTFSARKLGMRSTGNADGFYNLRLVSDAPGGDWLAMLRRLGTGLVVTGLQGGSIDPTSGNWTHAVKGLWVEEGMVVHAVNDVTLAGSMPAMLTGIQAVGSDIERQGAISTGSILIDEMQVGGGA